VRKLKVIINAGTLGGQWEEEIGLPLQPDRAPSPGEKSGGRASFLGTTLVFPRRQPRIVTDARQLRELRVAIAPLTAVTAVGDDPVRGTDQHSVHDRSV